MSSNPDNDDDDDVFVTADPVLRKDQPRSAMIVSAVNPYCTTARAPKAKSAATAIKPWSVTVTHSNDLVHSSNSSSNGDGVHDQDSGYDGYCPKSSSPESSSNSVTSSSVEEDEDSVYYNHRALRESSSGLYGRIIVVGSEKSPSRRPQSVYERQFDGPVQHSLDLLASPRTRDKTAQEQISQATVVNLVRNVGRPLPPIPVAASRVAATATATVKPRVPPPLPPRPQGGLRHPEVHQLRLHESYSTSSLPRPRRASKLSLAEQRSQSHGHRRSLLHLKEQNEDDDDASAAPRNGEKNVRFSQHIRCNQDEHSTLESTKVASTLKYVANSIKNHQVKKIC
jgi:hypothetical protein